MAAERVEVMAAALVAGWVAVNAATVLSHAAGREVEAGRREGMARRCDASAALFLARRTP